MIQQKLRKAGNSFIVTIPKDEVERRGLKVGQLLAVEVHPLELRPVLPDDLREAFEASWKENAPGYEYLAGR
jgi:antitoxin component of MazEF toxin-antitoxin module